VVDARSYRCKACRAPPKKKHQGKPFFYRFKTKPLHFSCRAGNDGEQNAIVNDIDQHVKECFPALKIGMQIVRINGESAVDLPFIEIRTKLRKMSAPLVIGFQQPPPVYY
jgi:hypothetical protein